MSEPSSFDFQQFKQEWVSALQYLKEYIKSPVTRIKQLPDWDWRTLMALQATVAGISGLLSGVVAAKPLSIVLGAIFLPISSVAVHLIISGFFYYLFMFLLAREVNYKQIFTLMFLANIPFYALYIIHSLVAPVVVVGLLVTALLMIVGFVDYFALPKKKVVRIVGSLYLIYFALWVFSVIELNQKKKEPVTEATQESLDILEKELKGN